MLDNKQLYEKSSGVTELKSIEVKEDKIDDLVNQLVSLAEKRLNINKPKPILVYYVSGSMDRFRQIIIAMNQSADNKSEIFKEYHVMPVKSHEPIDRFELFNSDKVPSIEIKELRRRLNLEK